MRQSGPVSHRADSFLVIIDSLSKGAQAIGEQDIRPKSASQKPASGEPATADEPSPAPIGPPVKLASGLVYELLKEGTGPVAKSGQTVIMHYTGRLEDGTVFDSSRGRGKPFTTKIGVGQVIGGWDEGVPGMKIGERRKLIIPPALGYGANGSPPKIPGNATLIFDVELLDAK
jgi:FKBP-type peptidyl-prolyl cis-trans isomerase